MLAAGSLAQEENVRADVGETVATGLGSFLQAVSAQVLLERGPMYRLKACPPTSFTKD